MPAAPRGVVLLLHHKTVHIKVKAAEIIAQENCCAPYEGAKVEFRSRTRIQASQVLTGDRGAIPLARKDDCLHTGEHFTWPVSGYLCASAVRKGLEESQKLYPLVHGKLGYLLNAQTP